MRCPRVPMNDVMHTAEPRPVADDRRPSTLRTARLPGRTAHRPYTRAAMTRLPRAAVLAAALAVLATACALPHPHFQGPVPKIPPLPQTSMMVDDHGHLIRALHAGENRVLIPLSQVPRLAQDAVIGIEDARFYSHHGVDLKAVARAALADVKAGAPIQGGSTITEQLVK